MGSTADRSRDGWVRKGLSATRFARTYIWATGFPRALDREPEASCGHDHLAYPSSFSFRAIERIVLCLLVSTLLCGNCGCQPNDVSNDRDLDREGQSSSHVVEMTPGEARAVFDFTSEVATAAGYHAHPPDLSDAERGFCETIAQAIVKGSDARAMDSANGGADAGNATDWVAGILNRSRLAPNYTEFFARELAGNPRLLEVVRLIQAGAVDELDEPVAAVREMLLVAVNEQRHRRHEEIGLVSMARRIASAPSTATAFLQIQSDVERLDELLRSYDERRRALVQDLTAAISIELSVDLSTDGRSVATGGANGIVHLWLDRAAESPSVLRNTQSGVAGADGASAVFAVRLLGDSKGRELLTADRQGRIRLWRGIMGKMTPQVTEIGGFAARSRALDASPDASLIVAGADNGQVNAWVKGADGNGEYALTVLREPDQSPVISVDINQPGDQTILVASGTRGQMQFWWLDQAESQLTIRRETSVPLPGSSAVPISAVAVSPSMQHVVAGAADGGLFAWSLSTDGSAVAIQRRGHDGEHTGVVSDVVWLNNDTFLTSSFDGRLRQWQLEQVDDRTVFGVLAIDIGDVDGETASETGIQGIAVARTGESGKRGSLVVSRFGHSVRYWRDFDFSQAAPRSSMQRLTSSAVFEGTGSDRRSARWRITQSKKQDEQVGRIRRELQTIATNFSRHPIVGESHGSAEPSADSHAVINQLATVVSEIGRVAAAVSTLYAMSESDPRLDEHTVGRPSTSWQVTLLPEHVLNERGLAGLHRVRTVRINALHPHGLELRREVTAELSLRFAAGNHAGTRIWREVPIGAVLDRMSLVQRLPAGGAAEPPVLTPLSHADVRVDPHVLSAALYRWGLPTGLRVASATAAWDPDSRDLSILCRFSGVSLTRGKTEPLELRVSDVTEQNGLQWQVRRLRDEALRQLVAIANQSLSDAEPPPDLRRALGGATPVAVRLVSAAPMTVDVDVDICSVHGLPATMRLAWSSDVVRTGGEIKTALEARATSWKVTGIRADSLNREMAGLTLVSPLLTNPLDTKLLTTMEHAQQAEVSVRRSLADTITTMATELAEILISQDLIETPESPFADVEILHQMFRDAVLAHAAAIGADIATGRPYTSAQALATEALTQPYADLHEFARVATELERLATNERLIEASVEAHKKLGDQIRSFAKLLATELASSMQSDSDAYRELHNANDRMNADLFTGLERQLAVAIADRVASEVSRPQDVKRTAEPPPTAPEKEQAAAATKIAAEQTAAEKQWTDVILDSVRRTLLNGLFAGSDVNPLIEDSDTFESLAWYLGNDSLKDEVSLNSASTLTKVIRAKLLESEGSRIEILRAFARTYQQSLTETMQARQGEPGYAFWDVAERLRVAQTTCGLEDLSLGSFGLPLESFVADATSRSAPPNEDPLRTVRERAHAAMRQWTRRQVHDLVERRAWKIPQGQANVAESVAALWVRRIWSVNSKRVERSINQLENRLGQWHTARRKLEEAVAELRLPNIDVTLEALAAPIDGNWTATLHVQLAPRVNGMKHQLGGMLERNGEGLESPELPGIVAVLEGVPLEYPAAKRCFEDGLRCGGFVGEFRSIRQLSNLVDEYHARARDLAKQVTSPEAVEGLLTTLAHSRVTKLEGLGIQLEGRWDDFENWLDEPWDRRAAVAQMHRQLANALPSSSPLRQALDRGEPLGTVIEEIARLNHLRAAEVLSILADASMPDVPRFVEHSERDAQMIARGRSECEQWKAKVNDALQKVEAWSREELVGAARTIDQTAVPLNAVDDCLTKLRGCQNTLGGLANDVLTDVANTQIKQCRHAIKALTIKLQACRNDARQLATALQAESRREIIAVLASMNRVPAVHGLTGVVEDLAAAFDLPSSVFTLDGLNRKEVLAALSSRIDADSVRRLLLPQVQVRLDGFRLSLVSVPGVVAVGEIPAPIAVHDLHALHASAKDVAERLTSELDNGAKSLDAGLANLQEEQRRIESRFTETLAQAQRTYANAIDAAKNRTAEDAKRLVQDARQAFEAARVAAEEQLAGATNGIRDAEAEARRAFNAVVQNAEAQLNGTIDALQTEVNELEDSVEALEQAASQHVETMRSALLDSDAANAVRVATARLTGTGRAAERALTNDLSFELFGTSLRVTSQLVEGRLHLTGEADLSSTPFGRQLPRVRVVGGLGVKVAPDGTPDVDVRVADLVFEPPDAPRQIVAGLVRDISSDLQLEQCRLEGDTIVAVVSYSPSGLPSVIRVVFKINLKSGKIDGHVAPDIRQLLVHKLNEKLGAALLGMDLANLGVFTFAERRDGHMPIDVQFEGNHIVVRLKGWIEVWSDPPIRVGVELSISSHRGVRIERIHPPSLPGIGFDLDGLPVSIALDSPEWYSLNDGFTLLLRGDVEIEGLGLRIGCAFSIGQNGIRLRDQLRMQIPGWYDTGYISLGNFEIGIDPRNKIVQFGGAVTLTPGEGFNRIVKVRGVGQLAIRDLQFKVTGTLRLLGILSLANSQTTIDFKALKFSTQMQTSSTVSKLLKLRQQLDVFAKGDKLVFTSATGGIFGVEIADAELTVLRSLAADLRMQFNLFIGEIDANVGFGPYFSSPHVELDGHVGLGPFDVVTVELDVTDSRTACFAEVDLGFTIAVNIEAPELTDITPDWILQELLYLFDLRFRVPSAGIALGGKNEDLKPSSYVPDDAVHGQVERPTEPPDKPSAIEGWTSAWRIEARKRRVKKGWWIFAGYKWVVDYVPVYADGQSQAVHPHRPPEELRDSQTYYAVNDRFLITSDMANKTIRIYEQKGASWPLRWTGRTNDPRAPHEVIHQSAADINVAIIRQANKLWALLDQETIPLSKADLGPELLERVNTLLSRGQLGPAQRQLVWLAGYLKRMGYTPNAFSVQGAVGMIGLEHAEQRSHVVALGRKLFLAANFTTSDEEVARLERCTGTLSRQFERLQTFFRDGVDYHGSIVRIDRPAGGRHYLILADPNTTGPSMWLARHDGKSLAGVWRVANRSSTSDIRGALHQVSAESWTSLAETLDKTGAPAKDVVAVLSTLGPGTTSGMGIAVSWVAADNTPMLGVIRPDCGVDQLRFAPWTNVRHRLLEEDRVLVPDTAEIDRPDQVLHLLAVPGLWKEDNWQANPLGAVIAETMR